MTRPLPRTREAFLAGLGDVAEHSPWVAEAAWAHAPFADLDAIVRAFADAIRSAPTRARVDLVAAHPDLAGRAALAGELGASSAQEQAGAGLDRLSPEVFERFGSLNDAYRTRFGFPFVVCVREHTVGSILDEFERRLPNPREVEIDTAVEEVVKIVELRIRERLG